MEFNRSAVDAISERVAEVTALAEELDAALCQTEVHQINNILDSPTSTQEVSVIKNIIWATRVVFEVVFHKKRE